MDSMNQPGSPKPFRSASVQLGLFLACALVASACSKAELVGKGNKLKTVPVIATSITPSEGPIAGGTLVTIQGSGFMPGTQVNIGGTPCSNVDVISTYTMTCTTAASTTGGVETVNVITPTAEASNLTFAYLQAVRAIATTISSGGGFSYSGVVSPTGVPIPLSQQIMMRATIGVVSGSLGVAGPTSFLGVTVPSGSVAGGNIAIGTGIIKLGGLQGIIKTRNGP